MASSRSAPALSNSAMMSASLVASATTAVARTPAATISATTASSAAFARPATRTLSPSAANRLHSCAPRPWSGPTPMTIAVPIDLSCITADGSIPLCDDRHHDNASGLARSAKTPHRENDGVRPRFAVDRDLLIFRRRLKFLRRGVIREFHDHDLVALPIAFQHDRLLIRHEQLALEFPEHAGKARLVSVVQFALREFQLRDDVNAHDGLPTALS